MKKTMKTVIAIMTVSVMALTACSPFHPSKDLAGSAPIEKSTDGLEKLDDKKTEQFLQAVNKKYAVAMNDVSASFWMVSSQTKSPSEVNFWRTTLDL